MKCERCDTDLVPGYAIDPKYIDSCCRWSRQLLTAEQVEIVFVAKCPKCGLCEQLTVEQQAKLKSAIPPGYESWNQFWAAEKKVLPRKWLRTTLGL